MEAAAMILTAAPKVIGGIAANKAGKQNQRVLNEQALEEERAGSLQELRIRENARKAIGEQVAAQASNGFLGNSGSALDALAESQTNMVLDALTVRREAAARAKALREEGSIRRSQGKWALIEGLVGAAAGAYSQQRDWAAAGKAGG